MSSDGRKVRSTFTVGFIGAALLAGLYLAACSGGGDSSSGITGATIPLVPPVVPPVAPPVVTTAITQVIDDPANLGVQVIMTSSNTLAAGTLIVISGATNPTYNGTFTVVSATATTFTITAAFVGNDTTGVWQVGGGLIAGCTTTGAAGAITLSSTASRFTGVGPLAVFFDATATTAVATTRPFHDLEYRWNFGDTLGSPVSGTTWGTGSRAGSSSRNTATGPTSAHVFERPGTYIVTLTVVDGANTVSNACTQIAVLDPNVVFAGAKTTCFSTSGTFAGCPSGAVPVMTSDFVAAMATATAQSRLLFRGGEIFTAATPSTLTAAGPGIIGSFPTGTAAIVQMTGNNNVLRISTGATPTFADWRVMDLEMDLQAGASARGVQGTGDQIQMLFLRLNIHDGHNGFTYSDPAVPNWDQIFIVDTTIARIIGGGGGYGVFMSATRLGFLGNFVDDLTLAEHNTRFPYLGKAVISNNTLSRPGTSGKALMKLHAPDFPTFAAFTENIVISDNRLTSSSANWMFEIQPQTNPGDERLRNIIVERNYFTAAAGFNAPVIGVAGSEITVRNNIVDITGSIAFTGFQIHREGTEPPPDQVRVYNNSFFSSDAGVAPRFIIVGALATNITVKNNLAYAPAMTPVVSMIADSSGGGVVASNNTSNAQVTGTAPAWVSVTPAAVGDYGLTAPSYIAGDATVPVFSDFFRASRPSAGVIDIGATEF